MGRRVGGQRRQLVFARSLTLYVGPPRALPALVVVVSVAAVVELKLIQAMARRFAQRPSPTFLLSFAFFLSSCLAQNPAINTPVPPLQWIELTSLLSGSPPPPMKYASIGYDSTSGTIVVFGGERNGFPSQNTYLCVYTSSLSLLLLTIYFYSLNTTSLTWSTPVPPSGLNILPPPRSEAISGQDFAASKCVWSITHPMYLSVPDIIVIFSRHGHIVIGGKGQNGSPLSDAWVSDDVTVHEEDSHVLTLVRIGIRLQKSLLDAD